MRLILLFATAEDRRHGVEEKKQAQRVNKNEIKENAQSRKLVVLAHDLSLSLSPYLFQTSSAAATDRHEPIIVSLEKKCVNKCLIQSKQVYADLPATLFLSFFFFTSFVCLLFLLRLHRHRPFVVFMNGYDHVMAAGCAHQIDTYHNPACAYRFTQTNKQKKKDEKEPNGQTTSNISVPATHTHANTQVVRGL